MTITPAEAQALSVQGQLNMAPGWTVAVTERGAMLPAYGSQSREQALRRLYRNPHNTLIQGAFMGMASKIVSTPFEVNAPNSEEAENAQEMLRLVDFGKGFEHLFSVTVLDYLRHDRGAWWELIGYGRPDQPLRGAPVSIAHLDALRCYPTGDREYPIYYWATDGSLHKMHRTRVVQFVDMPDGDDDYPLVGLSALSRAAAVAQRQILMGNYIAGRLDDKPKPGLAVATNMGPSERDAAFRRMNEEQGMGETPAWGRTTWLFGIDPAAPVKIDMVNFAEAPEKFDFPGYVLLDVNELTVALGVDKQELWELTGGGIGTGTQSVILAAKSRGKTFGRLLKGFERALNFYGLPPACEFTWKYRDPQEDAERASIASAYAQTVISLIGVLSPLEQRQILANQVEAFSDVLLDGAGRVRLPDDDRQPATAEATLNDDTLDNENGEEASTESGQSVPTTAPTPPAPAIRKDWAGTRETASVQFASMVNAARGDDISRRSLTLRMRGWLKRWGERAYLDGVQESGDDATELDSDARAEVQAWLSTQAAFGRDFSAEVFSSGLSETQVVQRASAWVENSLGEMHLRGVASVKRNQMFKWVMDPSAENCRTCLALSGQVHRLKDFLRVGLRPKAFGLECFIGCKCQLLPTDEKVTGRLRMVPIVRRRSYKEFCELLEKSHAHA